MDIVEATRAVEEGRIEPVYVVFGSETFFVQGLVRALKNHVATGPMADFNYSRIRGKEMSGAEIVATAQAVPMMSSRRLVIVDDAGELSARDLEPLAEYFEAPCESTCLCLVAAKLDLRKGVWAKANKRKLVYKAEPIGLKQVDAFVRSRARERGVEITSEACAAVGAAVGNDCVALEDAVERLSLFVGEKGLIDVDHVASVVSAIKPHSVFELVDAIGEKRADRALFILEHLIAERQDPIMINAMIARHFRQLLGARIHMHLKTPQNQMAASLGVPPFVVGKITSQCRRFRGAMLERGLARLAQVDLLLKSARRSGAHIVEEAVLDLCLH